MNRGVFITGTDTDIGKTVVTAGLVASLRQNGYDMGVMKPFQSGAPEVEGKLLAPDIDFVLEMTDLEADYDLINPIRLKPPLAPSIAAEVEGVEVDINDVKLAYQELQKQFEGLIVEGAGGLIVPLAEDFLVPDLVKMLELPIIIVARPNLGTINHTVLTVKVARQLGLEVLGVIINGLKADEMGTAEETNPEIISKLGDVPILGIIPYIEGLDGSAEQVNLGRIIKESVDVDYIVNSL